MIVVFIYYNKHNNAQIKIIIKKNIKINIICNSLTSLYEQLDKLKQLKFADKIIIVRGTSLISDSEILQYLVSESQLINYKQLATIIMPHLNFIKSKPVDLPAYIQNISPISITYTDAEKILQIILDL